MSQYQKLCAATSMICVLGLSGCANPPTSLGKVPPREDFIAKYGRTPNYNAVDKFSFTQAEVLYPASGGHHRIGVGDFLLGEVFDIFEQRPMQLVRLLRFKSQCDPSGLFAPHAICATAYEIEMDDGQRSFVQSTISAVDVGNIRVRQDPFLLVLPIVIGDDFFQRQIGPLLEAIKADLRQKLAPTSNSN